MPSKNPAQPTQNPLDPLPLKPLANDPVQSDDDIFSGSEPEIGDDMFLMDVEPEPEPEPEPVHVPEPKFEDIFAGNSSKDLKFYYTHRVNQMRSSSEGLIKKTTQPATEALSCSLRSSSDSVSVASSPVAIPTIPRRQMVAASCSVTEGSEGTVDKMLDSLTDRPPPKKCPSGML